MSSVGIVTGAGRGMGRACAEQLVERVDHLLAVDLDADGAAAAAEELNGFDGASVEAVAMDVTDTAALAQLARRAGELGTLGPVLHAAGISPTMADWRRIVTVDLVGTALLVEALRSQLGSGSAVVCFSSMSAMLMPPPSPELRAVLAQPLAENFLERLREVAGDALEEPGQAYPIAKFGVQVYVQHEASRLGAAGARICSVSPGIIATPQGALEKQQHPIMDKIVEQAPIAREGRAEELAAAAAWLASPGASFVTGTDLLVDGGAIAGFRTGSIVL